MSIMKFISTNFAIKINQILRNSWYKVKFEQNMKLVINYFITLSKLFNIWILFSQNQSTCFFLIFSNILWFAEIWIGSLILETWRGTMFSFESRLIRHSTFQPGLIKKQILCILKVESRRLSREKHNKIKE